MIRKINIKDVASFNASDHIMDDLGRVNFIFGANGSGKTTISRVLSHPDNYPSCDITWENARFKNAMYTIPILLIQHSRMYLECRAFSH